MPTIRETILQAPLAVLQTVPAASVLREEVLPERINAGGLVFLRDGDPGTPEVTLSPLAYSYEHRAELEVIVQGKTPAARATAFGALVRSMGVVGSANCAVACPSISHGVLSGLVGFLKNISNSWHAAAANCQCHKIGVHFVIIRNNQAMFR